MKIVYPVVIGALALIGCNPDSSDFKSVADCETYSDPNNNIVRVDSQFQSYPTESPDYDLPLDMDLSVDIYTEGLSETVVESVYMAYPNGQAFEAGQILTSISGDPYFSFSHASFESYSKTSGLSMAPMTDYCVQVNFANGDAIAKRIDMERADGTAPNSGEQMVHDSHYALITSGGDYSKAMAIPVVDALSVSDSEMTIAITLNDIRATQIDGFIFDDTGEIIAAFYISKSNGLKNDGKKTYSISYDDLTYLVVSPSELALSAYYVMLMVEDDWNGLENYSYQSELSSFSGPHFF